jgi:hypothetical protein
MRNHFSYKHFKKVPELLTKRYLEDITHYHLLDIYPSRVLNIDLLSKLLGKHINLTKRMTFSFVFDAFSKFADGEDQISRSVSDQLIKATRKFCPVCLREGITHRLSWQVKNILVCHIHKVGLQDLCHNCNSQQPYMNRGYTSRFYCNKCGIHLGEQVASKITFENGFIDEQMKIYGDWKYLISGEVLNSKLIQETGVEYCAALHYVNQNFPSTYDKTLGTVSMSQHAAISTYLKGDSIRKNIITLERTFTMIRPRNISLMQLLNIDVPDSFRSSLLEAHASKERLIPGSCLSPWCSYFNSSHGMMRVKRTTAHVSSGRQRFDLPCVCSGCYIIYGYDKNNVWHEVDEHIELGYRRILPLISIGYSLEKIKQQLRIPHPKLLKFIGYFAQHRMMPEEAGSKFIPTQKEDDVLKKFITLDEQEGPMPKIAKKLFNWSAKEYYYYFADIKVQDYFINRAKKIRGRGSRAKKKWAPKVEEVLTNLVEQEIVISFREVAAGLDVTPGLLNEYNFNDIIEDYKTKQVHIFRSKLYKEAELYIRNRRGERAVQIESFFKTLGKTKKWIHSQFPEFKDWLDKQLDRDSQEFKTLQMIELEKKTSGIIEKIRLDGRPVTKQEIAKELGFNIRTLGRNPVIRNVMQRLL